MRMRVDFAPLDGITKVVFRQVWHRRFGGADVLATSYTLSQGIRRAGPFDLILCGKQTTDGDTAQVGSEISEALSLPAVAGVLGLRAAAALFSPLALSLQNAAAEPGARAAQLSCNAMVMDVVSLVLNPAFGRAADAGCGQALLLGATACGGGLLLFWAGAKPAASPA